MQITICDGDRIANVDLPEDCPVENLVALVLVDLENDSHDAASVQLLKDGKNVLAGDRTRSLTACGLVNGDLLLYRYLPAAAAPAAAAPAANADALAIDKTCQRAYNEISLQACGLVNGDLLLYRYLPAAAAPAAAAPAASDDPLEASRKRMTELLNQGLSQLSKKIKLPKTKEQKEEEECREVFGKMNEPMMKSHVFQLWPALHHQFVKNPTDYDGFKREFSLFMAAEQKKIDSMFDENSEEGQKLVLERINRERCERLYQEAMDKMPEAFFPVHMLYVRVKVNKVPTIAFIDSGAAISLMSLKFVQKANIEHLMDTRMRTVVSGIGGADRMEGTIYSCKFELGDVEFSAKVNVGKDKMDILIGLDFMRRHHCTIDLARNRLSFTETCYAEFLSDAEINAVTAGRDLDTHHSFKVDDAKLAELMGMGFEKKDAEKALAEAINDVPDAVRRLYAQAHDDAEAIAASAAEAAAAAAAAVTAEAAAPAESEEKMEH